MEKSVWRRIAWIEFWLMLFPPWGLWLLWSDPVLTRSLKQRVLIYTVLIPLIVMMAMSLGMIHMTELAIKAGGGD